jgi:hypothetical protein
VIPSFYRLFTDFFRPLPKIVVGDLVKVTKRIANIGPDEALVVIGPANMTQSWIIADVVRPGSSDKRTIDLAGLQKWDGTKS